jgi:hypothetical protein
MAVSEGVMVRTAIAKAQEVAGTNRLGYPGLRWFCFAGLIFSPNMPLTVSG